MTLMGVISPPKVEEDCSRLKSPKAIAYPHSRGAQPSILVTLLYVFSSCTVSFGGMIRIVCSTPGLGVKLMGTMTLYTGCFSLNPPLNYPEQGVGRLGPLSLSTPRSLS